MQKKNFKLQKNIIFDCFLSKWISLYKLNYILIRINVLFFLYISNTNAMSLASMTQFHSENTNPKIQKYAGNL